LVSLPGLTAVKPGDDSEVRINLNEMRSDAILVGLASCGLSSVSVCHSASR
jgi:hypothetical protein